MPDFEADDNRPEIKGIMERSFLGAYIKFGMQAGLRGIGGTPR